jgi:hypothetical protein
MGNEWVGKRAEKSEWRTVGGGPWTMCRGIFVPRIDGGTNTSPPHFWGQDPRPFLRFAPEYPKVPGTRCFAIPALRSGIPESTGYAALRGLQMKNPICPRPCGVPQKTGTGKQGAARVRGERPRMVELFLGNKRGSILRFKEVRRFLVEGKKRIRKSLIYGSTERP